jgi:hypothetical protein
VRVTRQEKFSQLPVSPCAWRLALQALVSRVSMLQLPEIPEAVAPVAVVLALWVQVEVLVEDVPPQYETSNAMSKRRPMGEYFFIRENFPLALSVRAIGRSTRGLDKLFSD